MSEAWRDKGSAFLRLMVERGELSFAEMVGRINSELGTTYTRSALIGRAHRMGFANPAPVARARTSQRTKNKNLAARRKAKRWAENPSLEQREARINEKRQIRASFVAKGTSMTSRDYRVHLPRLPEMSKGELREMLAQAIRNTAAMEEPA